MPRRLRLPTGAVVALGLSLAALRDAPAQSIAVARGLVPALLAAAPSAAGNVPAAAVEALKPLVLELGRFAHEQGGVASVSIVRVRSGEELAELEPERLVNPASNQKLLTAAVVLDALGSGFRIKTSLLGEIQGAKIPKLVLRSRGSPAFSSSDLFELARTLRARGVTEVGELAVDQSYFDGAFVPPAFEQQPNEWAAFRAPVSAVALDENTVTLHVGPSAAGSPATAWFEPPGFVDVKGTVTSRADVKTHGVGLTLSPSGTRLSALLSGYVAAGQSEYALTRRIDDPSLFAAYALRHFLATLGITVPDKPVLGGAAETRELASVQSPALAVMLQRLGKDSDNFTAEMLLKVLAAEKTKLPGTSAGGAQMVADWMQKEALLPAGARITNGSGLFDANRATAREITALLRRVYGDPKLQTDYLAQLSIAGVDGTLALRLRQRAACACVRAKTGTLRDVGALSGYVLTPNGDAVAFALFVNGVANRHAEIRKRFDRIVDTLVEN